MAVKTNPMRILDKAKIPYTTYSYENKDGKIDGISVANKVGIPCASVYKTLVAKGNTNYYIFVIAVDKELNLKSAAKSVNEKSVTLINPADLMKITGYIRGGCSPIGMKKEFPTVIDTACEKLENIVISGGKIGYQISISPDDLAKVISYTTYNLTDD